MELRTPLPTKKLDQRRFQLGHPLGVQNEICWRFLEYLIRDFVPFQIFKGINKKVIMSIVL